MAVKNQEKDPLSPGQIGKRVLANVLTRILTAVAAVGILLLLFWAFRGQLTRFFRDVIGGFAAESSVLTDTELESRLEAIGELASYEYAYTGEREIRSTRKLLGMVNIPGTTHRIRMTYQGIIKTGCRVENISIHFNRQDNTIQVTFPKPHVLDHYIDMESLQIEQSNNILNPIGSDEITRDLEMVKAEELKKAEEKNIYVLAEENIRTMIRNLLTDTGREVVFLEAEDPEEENTEMFSPETAAP